VTEILDCVAIQRKPIRQQLAIFEAVAVALAAFHEQGGLLHLDVKPPNILLSEPETEAIEVHIIDFDHSVFTMEDVEAENLVGDRNYYAPEVVQLLRSGRTAARLTQKADIFSLGVVFCEYLTGHPTLHGKGEEFYQLAYDGTLASRLGETRWCDDDTLSVRLSALLVKMLARQASQRPAARDVAEALQIVREEWASRKSQSKPVVLFHLDSKEKPPMSVTRVAEPAMSEAEHSGSAKRTFPPKTESVMEAFPEAIECVAGTWKHLSSSLGLADKSLPRYRVQSLALIGFVAGLSVVLGGWIAWPGFGLFERHRSIIRPVLEQLVPEARDMP
jgi:serine/threonine protein kinase